MTQSASNQFLTLAALSEHLSRSGDPVLITAVGQLLVIAQGQGGTILAGSTMQSLNELAALFANDLDKLNQQPPSSLSARDQLLILRTLANRLGYQAAADQLTHWAETALTRSSRSPNL